MEIIQMEGFNVFAIYCDAYYDCATSSLPQFPFAQDYAEHARNIVDKGLVLGRLMHSKSGPGSLK